MTTGVVPALDPIAYRELVRRALNEDVGGGDLTTEAIISPAQRARGAIVAKTPCVLAGADVAIEAFRQMDPDVAAIHCRADGDRCVPGERVLEVTGTARALLSAERTALNFLQRLTGIATLTRRFVEASGGRITILDTRKTTPTLRVLEKYAVRVGGGTNHRMALDAAVLIKDNHVRVAGGVTAALARAREKLDQRSIEIEIQNLAELDEALAAGATRILVDNFAPEALRESVRRSRGRATIEVSGGVTLDKIVALAGSGADFVSVGALTHSAPAADLSFDVEPA